MLYFKYQFDTFDTKKHKRNHAINVCGILYRSVSAWDHANFDHYYEVELLAFVYHWSGKSLHEKRMIPL